MPELDALVSAYQHLEHMPRAVDALHTLRKVASLVKPIMRNRHWRIGTLTEFYPDQANLLGLNVNRGQSICLRLRNSSNQDSFISLENVVDTMLHELSHMVHGDHDAAFHKLWDELRDEYTTLKLKGYSGEGFLSDGHRLGGRGVPVTELRRRARAEAEKRRDMDRLMKGSGQKLGGKPILRGVDMREVIATAVSERNNITKGCVTGTIQGKKAAEEAQRSGVRTTAEEDDANDRAIAQALWELIQEEEARKVGLDPPDTTTNPPPLQENDPSEKPAPSTSSGRVPPIPTASKPSQPAPPKNRTSQSQRPQSRLLAEHDKRHKKPLTSRLISEDEERRRAAAAASTFHAPAPPDPEPEPELEPSEWSCQVCTLNNPTQYLACDACGSERPQKQPQSAQPSTSILPSTLGWKCEKCGTFLEHQWWVCNVCGQMKASSSISA